MTESIALSPNALELAQHVCQTWVMTAPPATTIERLQDSDFYRHVGPKLGRGDIIRWVNESAGFFAEILVREGRESNRQGFVSVALLRTVELPLLQPDTADRLPAGHSVQWLGEAERWAVLRGAQVLKNNFGTKSEALQYVGNLALVGAV